MDCVSLLWRRFSSAVRRRPRETWDGGCIWSSAMLTGAGEQGCGFIERKLKRRLCCCCCGGGDGAIGTPAASLPLFRASLFAAQQQTHLHLKENKWKHQEGVNFVSPPSRVAAWGEESISFFSCSLLHRTTSHRSSRPSLKITNLHIKTKFAQKYSAKIETCRRNSSNGRKTREHLFRSKMLDP